MNPEPSTIMPTPLLQIENLHVSVENKEILKGISLEFLPGKIYALMGPNGSGKSTLASALAGHPKYQVTQGKMLVSGEEMTHLSADLRAQKGLFLSFQYPKNIPGVTLSNFLRAAYKAVKKKEMRVFEFQKLLKEKMDLLEIPRGFMDRFVNEGFSGGEKKKAEILQALVLEPKVILLDETDSGLDVDALKIVAEGIQKLINPSTTILLITHYFRILQYLRPDVVHILKEGSIVASGGASLAQSIEDQGFDSILIKGNEKQRSLLENMNPLFVLD